MSTVSSIDTYCKIAGLSEYLILISDSQEIEGLVSSCVSADIVSEYGSFMAIARDGEIELIWGVSTYVAWNTSAVELIWSAKAFYRSIKRKNARRVKESYADREYRIKRQMIANGEIKPDYFAE